jgi:hypothetical protein
MKEEWMLSTGLRSRRAFCRENRLSMRTRACPRMEHGRSPDAAAFGTPDP